MLFFCKLDILYLCHFLVVLFYIPHVQSNFQYIFYVIYVIIPYIFFISHSDIFPSSFLQLLSSSRNSILNLVMKLTLPMCAFFAKHLKDFPFYSPIPLTLWFRYLQIHTKERCIFLVNFSLKFPIKL